MIQFDASEVEIRVAANLVHAVDAHIQNMSQVKHSVSDIVSVIKRRNGKQGVELILSSYYGGRISNQEVDELLICSRIANKGE